MGSTDSAASEKATDLGSAHKLQLFHLYFKNIPNIWIISEYLQCNLYAWNSCFTEKEHDIFPLKAGLDVLTRVRQGFSTILQRFYAILFKKF